MEGRGAYHQTIVVLELLALLFLVPGVLAQVNQTVNLTGNVTTIHRLSDGLGLWLELIACFTISLVAFFWSISSQGLYLQRGLANLFIGIPASTGCLHLAPTVEMFGVVGLYLSISLILAHLGIMIINLMVTPSNKDVKR